MWTVPVGVKLKNTFRIKIMFSRNTLILQDTAGHENLWVVFGAQKYEYSLAT